MNEPSELSCSAAVTTLSIQARASSPPSPACAGFVITPNSARTPHIHTTAACIILQESSRTSATISTNTPCYPSLAEQNLEKAFKPARGKYAASSASYLGA